MNFNNAHEESDKIADPATQESSLAVSKDADLSTPEVLEILRRNFAEIDRNDDGFTSSRELLAAMQGTEYGSNTYKALYSVEKNIKTVEALSNDEWGCENDGVTKKDLNKLGAAVKGRAWLDMAFTLSSANEKPDSMPDFTRTNSKIVGAANAIRTATKKDNWVDLGTDEKAINSVLKNLSEDERSKLKELYEKRFGTSLESEFKSELSGVDLEKSLNLLERKDSQADDVGFFRELAKDRESFFGKTDNARNKAVRDKLASMSAKDIEAADKESVSRYKCSFSVLLHQVKLDDHTKSTLSVYLKGSDHRSEADVLALTDVALEARNLDMLREAMRGAPEDLRRAFMEPVGIKRLYDAFSTVGDVVYDDPNLVSSYKFKAQPRSLVFSTQFNNAIDIIENGGFSTGRIVELNSTLIGDNEKAIETALFQMNDEERKSYAEGKRLSRSSDPAIRSSAETGSLNVYERLNGALRGAGNATEMLMWEDQIEFKGGSLITELGRHNGFFMDSPMDDVLATIENVKEEDWNRLKNDANYRKRVEAVLRTYLSSNESERATDLIDTLVAPSEYKAARESGRRSVLDVIKDSSNRGFLWLDTKEDSIWNAIETMSEKEKERYRSDEKFKHNVDAALMTALGEGAEQEIAFSMLELVQHNEKPERTILEKLARYATHFSVDEAQVVAEVEDAFRKNPELHERIKNPKNFDESKFAGKFIEHLKGALGSGDFSRYGETLIENGYLPLEQRIQINKGIINLNETSLLRSLTTLSEKDLVALQQSSESQPNKLRRQLFSQLTDDEQELAMAVIDQKTFNPEDRLRAFVLGVGENKQELFTMMKQTAPEKRKEILQRYADKYGEDPTADFLSKFKSKERFGGEMAIEVVEQPRSQIVSDVVSETSASRDGIGKHFVDSYWDGTGFALDQAVDNMIVTVSDSAAPPDALAINELRGHVVSNLANFRDSKEQVAEVATDVGITGVALGASFFTGGLSLGLMAKCGIAGTAGALFKVAGKASIMGADYDATPLQLASDGGRGFVAAAAVFVGPSEIAKLTGIGNAAGTEAAKVALANIAEMAEVGGGQLLKQGSQALIEQTFQQLLREALVSGSSKVSVEAVRALASRVAVSGSEEGVKNVLLVSFGQAMQQQSGSMLSVATEYGLTAASGGFAGGSSGLILGASNIDETKSVEENVGDIANTTLVSTAAGATSAVALRVGFKVAGAGIRTVRGKGLPAHGDTYIAENPERVGWFKEHQEFRRAVQLDKDLPPYHISGSGKAGDWLVSDIDTGNSLVVKSDAFAKTYDRLPDSSNFYRRQPIDVMAVQLRDKIDWSGISTRGGLSTEHPWMILPTKGQPYFQYDHYFLRTYTPANPAAERAVGLSQADALRNAATPR